MASESFRVDCVQNLPSQVKPVSQLAGDLFKDPKVNKALHAALCAHVCDVKPSPCCRDR